MTTKLTEPARLRARIAELRKEIADTTHQFQVAKNKGQPDRVMLLLRKRSALIRELFEVQGELLASIRNASAASTTPVLCA